MRDQLDKLNIWMKTIWPHQEPAYKRPSISTKFVVATILIINYNPQSKLFSETEGFQLMMPFL